jgi:hypothetical protein
MLSGTQTEEREPDAPPRKRARRSVRFALHIERRFTPGEAAGDPTLMDDETRSVPTTPKVEARREAATALREAVAAPGDAAPSLLVGEETVRGHMRRIVDAKLEALRGLLRARSERASESVGDPDELFYARVPRATRIPGLWGARDLWAVTPESVAALLRLRAALLGAPAPSEAE